MRKSPTFSKPTSLDCRERQLLHLQQLQQWNQWNPNPASFRGLLRGIRQRFTLGSTQSSNTSFSWSKLRSQPQGFTLLEVLIAVALLGIAVGSIFYAFSMANVAAVQSRNRVSSAELGRTMVDMVHEGAAYVTSAERRGGNSLLIRNPNDLVDAPDDVVRSFQAYNNANRNEYTYGRLLGRPGVNPPTLIEFIPQPEGSTEPIFVNGPVASNASYYRFSGLPLYIPVNMGRTGANIPLQAIGTLIPATVVRLVETVNSPLQIGPDANEISDESEESSALRIRMVNLDISYEYQGKQYQTTVRTFKAPDQ